MIRGVAFNKILNLDPFLSFICQTSRNLNISFCWVRSHPERRQPDRLKWNFLEKGNNMADVIASGNLSALSNLFPAYEQIYSTYDFQDDIAPLLLSQATYSFTYNGIPISLQQIKHMRRNKLTTDYFEQRSQISTRGIDWMNLTYSLSYAVVSKLNHSASRISKTIFEKYITDQYRNLAEHECHLCHMDSDTIQHLITCPDRNAVGVRLNAKSQCDNIPIMESLEHLRYSLNRIKQNIYKLTKTEYMAWYGLFDPSAVRDIFEDINLRTLAPILTVKKQIKMWIAPWAHAAFDLIGLRNSSKMSINSTNANSYTESVASDSSNDILFSMSTYSQCDAREDYIEAEDAEINTPQSFLDYTVSVNTLLDCNFGNYSIIELLTGIDIRYQLCTHLGIPLIYSTFFEIQCRVDNVHIDVLPNNVDTAKGKLCNQLTSSDSLCLQWKSSPIRRHYQCHLLLPSYNYEHVRQRTTTLDGNSFYYSLGIGILQSMVCNHKLDELEQLCSDLLDNSSFLLTHDDQTTMVMLWKWTEHFVNKSANTDLIDYSLEFLIPFEPIGVFSLSKFCLLLGQLLVIQSLGTISSYHITELQTLHSEYSVVKNADELGNLILYPRSSPLPFHQNLLSESFLQEPCLALSIHYAHEDSIPIPREPILFGTHHPCMNAHIQIYSYQGYYGLLNTHDEYKYTDNWNNL